MGKIRWGILGGASFVANQAVIPALLSEPRSIISGFVSLSGGKDLLLAKLGVPRFSSYEALIKSGQVDVIYIALPNSLHKHWIDSAVNHNISVLCEKPISLDSSELKEVLVAAKSKKILVREAYMTPFHSRVKQVRRLINALEIGDINYIDTEFSFTLPMNNNYRWHKHLGGGALADVGIYLVEPIIDKFGFPTDVTISEFKKYGNIDICVKAKLVFEQGKTATIKASFVDIESQKLMYYGTLGQISLDRPFTPSLSDNKIIINRVGAFEVVVCPPDDPYRVMVASFVDELLGQVRSIYSLDRSLEVQLVLDQIIEIRP